jgi:hypothetical protein
LLIGLLPALLRYSEVLDAQYESQNIRSAVSHHGTRQRHSIIAESAIGPEGNFLDIDSSDNRVNFAVFFMQQYISNLLTDNITPEALAWHTLVYLLAKYDSRDESALTELFQGIIDRLERSGRLSQVTGGDESVLSKEEIDLQHCLRLCQRFSRPRARVLIYILLGIYTHLYFTLNCMHI